MVALDMELMPITADVLPLVPWMGLKGARLMLGMLKEVGLAD